MITPNAKLSISRQCMLLGIARSSFYLAGCEFCCLPNSLYYMR